MKTSTFSVIFLSILAISLVLLLSSLQFTTHVFNILLLYHLFYSFLGINLQGRPLRSLCGNHTISTTKSIPAPSEADEKVVLYTILIGIGISVIYRGLRKNYTFKELRKSGNASVKSEE